MSKGFQISGARSRGYSIDVQLLIEGVERIEVVNISRL